MSRAPSRRRILRSLRVVTPDGVRAADVLIEDGSVREVAGHGELDAVPDRASIEDLGELALLPGAVDLHVHVNEPGREEWEGFAHATRSAAAGGVTTLVDMPLNSTPVTTTPSALEAKRAAARGRCFVDVAFHGGVVPENAHDPEMLERLARAGLVGMKAFLCDSGLPEFPPVSHRDLEVAMPVLAAVGIPLLVHAERAAPESPAALLPMPRYADYLASRPQSMELRAVEELIALCRATRCRVHVVHLSAAEAVAPLRAAKEEGLAITVETCPHYLTFCSEEIDAEEFDAEGFDAEEIEAEESDGEGRAGGDTRFQCAPPIRDAENREGLWRALLDGTIDLVASDHSPCPPELKEGGFGAAWGGIASLQVAVSAVWSGLSERDPSEGLARLVDLTAARPARLLGLTRKGRIAPGADADLVAFDDAASIVVEGERLHHRHPLTPYEGRTLLGVARKTWLRGALVQQEGRVLERAPRGRLLSREGAT